MELVVGIILLLITLIPWWMIFRKAGYSEALGCLMVIPILNLIMLFYLAFAEWPIERELKYMRDTYGGN